MSKAIFELQESIRNSRDQINDILHLAYLNKESILCLNEDGKVPLKQIEINQQRSFDTKKNSSSALQTNQQKFCQLNNQRFLQKFNGIMSSFQKRSQIHMNYLIVKQIQEEEQSVRRDRLNQYEDKIYDQRRLISDKEVFCESLFRPRKKKPEGMATQDFQQMRAQQKIVEQKQKLLVLEEQVRQFLNLRRKVLQPQIKIGKGLSDSMIVKKQIQLYKKVKNEQLQKAKAYSLQTASTTIHKTVQGKSEKVIQGQQITEPFSDKNQVQATEKQKNTQHLQNEKENNQSSDNYLNIEKIIQEFQKNDIPQEVKKQKIQQTINLLSKIKQKKQSNKQKHLQLKGLTQQNIHLIEHLKKLKQSYKLKIKDEYTKQCDLTIN